MRTIDLSPLYRSTVGYDRLAGLLDQVFSGDVAAPSYPPYNIEKTGEHDYRITLAVAGFAEAELNVEVKDATLTVTAEKEPVPEDQKRAYLHRGIAERGFERRFQLAEHVRVAGAELANGLLHIDLVREIPEALKPRTISISASNGRAKTIEA